MAKLLENIQGYRRQGIDTTFVTAIHITPSAQE